MLAFTFRKSLSKRAWVFGETLIYFFLMLFVHVLESENWVFRSLKTERYKILQMVFWSEGGTFIYFIFFHSSVCFSHVHVMYKETVLSISWTAELEAGELESFLRYCMFRVFSPPTHSLGPCTRPVEGAFVVPLFCLRCSVC